MQYLCLTSIKIVLCVILLSDSATTGNPVLQDIKPCNPTISLTLVTIRNHRRGGTPEFWAAVLTGLKNAWPQILGALMAGLIAYGRLIYDGATRKNKWLEGVLCGALSLCVTSALDVVGLPVSISPFVGGIIGFVGVDKLREIAISALKKRAGVNDENQ